MPSPLHITFMIAGLFLAAACSPTTACPEGMSWHGTEEGCRPDPIDIDGGQSDSFMPCGGACVSPEICNVDTNECVECLGEGASTCTGSDNACVGGVCVGCASDANCEDPAAPQCNTATNTCESCTSSDACSGRTGTEVCSGGRCVECGATDESACGTNVCDVEAGTCTTTPAGSVGVCAPCTSNRACADGTACVLQRFDEPPVDGTLVDIGYVCLPTGTACTAATAPFVNGEMLTDRAGMTVSVCGLRVATCPAYLNFGSTECTSDGDCGVPGVDDGLCRAGSPDTSSGMACTVRCAGAGDCDSGLGCSMTAPRRCCFGPSCM